MDPQANYDQLKSAVLGAQQQGSGDSPLGNFPELSKLYSSSFQLPVSNAAASAAGNVTSDIVAQQKAQAAAAAQAASSGGGGSRSGGGGFKIVARPDGGFGFYDANGNEVSANDYSQATGKDLSAVLKNSRNPVDRAFLQDYKQLNDYIKNKQNAANDPKARSAAQAVETQVRKLYNIPLHQQNPNEIINAFVQAYPTVFGGSAAGKQGTNTLLPSANTIKQNGKTSKYSLSSSGR